LTGLLSIAQDNLVIWNQFTRAALEKSTKKGEKEVESDPQTKEI
jgi:hypothetical protein